MKQFFLFSLLLLLCLSVCGCDLSSDRGTRPDAESQESSADTSDFYESESDLTAHTHSYTLMENTATCTQAGTALYACSCGESYTQSFPETGHDYQTTSTQPTCVSAGRTRSVCKVCGDTKTTVIRATGHKYSDWHVVVEATPTSDGTREKICTVCENVRTETFEYDNSAYINHAFEFLRLTDGTYAVSAKNCTEETVVIPSRSPTGGVVTEIRNFNNVLAKYIILPDTTTRICAGAFNNCTELVELTIPESVIAIGKRIAENTPSLKTVYFNAVACNYDGSDTSTGPFDQSYVEQVVFGDDVTYIGRNMFFLSTSLKQITLGRSITYIYNVAFGRNEALTEVIWNDALVYIGESAFARTSLTSLVLPDSVETISSYAFSNICLDCDELVLGNSLKKIGSGAFARAGHIRKLVVKTNGITTDSAPFEGTTVDSLQYADCVTELPASLFAKCEGPRTVTLGGSLVSVSERLFLDNATLQSVTLGDSITKIDTFAFSGCTSLVEVVGIENVTDIGLAAFQNCRGLKAIDLSSVDTFHDYAFSGTGLETVILSESLETIPQACFAGCSFKTIDLPNGLKTIGISAFSGAAIEEIIIPDSVTTIELYAFRYCSSLVSIKLPDNLTYISERMFEHCISLTSVTFPSNLTSISQNAFDSCTALVEMNLPDSVRSIGPGCFSDCTSLTTIHISTSLISIPNRMFDHCTSLTEVCIPPSVTSIGQEAFFGTGLTEVSLPDNCTYIGQFAFYACKNLTRVDFGGVQEIDKYAFTYCDALEEIVLPDGLLSIGFMSFANCTSATKLYLGNSLTFLDQQAFVDCSGIRSVYLPNSILSMRLDSSASLVSPFYRCGTVCYTAASSVSYLHYGYFGSVICGYSYEEYLAEIER